MNFNITDGLNIIAIGLNEDGASYFRFNTPCSMVWYDNHGSAGKYLTVMPYDQSERNAIQKQINESLFENFNNRIEDLYAILKPLLPLLQNGEYNLAYTDGTRKSYYYSGSGENAKQHEMGWNVLFGSFTEQAKMNLKIQEFKAYQKTHNREERRYDLTDFTTMDIYDSGGTYVYYATRPESEIDQQRVSYFKERIKNGDRPFAIIIQANCTNADLYSESFILDGHHKLLAYQNLGINPPLVHLTRVFKFDEVLEFDLNKLATVLYPWQLKHIIEYWENKKDLESLLERHGDLLRNYIWHGEHREYYDNGQLKLEGTYYYDRPNGAIREWYENGVAKSESHYLDCRSTGVWKEWFKSGQLKSEAHYNNGMPNGSIISYFENGKQRSLSVFENGKHADGYSFRRWLPTQKMECEVWYENNMMVKIRNYDTNGRLVESKYYNQEQKKLIGYSIVSTIYYQEEEEKVPAKEVVDLGIIRERQYPETPDSASNWRLILILIVLVMQLARMCHR